MRIVNLVQGSSEWLAWRRDGVGGSDVAALLGLSPFENATREHLLREKLVGEQRETTFAMRRGSRLEPVVRSLFEKRVAGQFPPVCIEDEHQPWARASLDGLAANGREILEIKCPAWDTHDWWLAGIVPDYYLAQIQWQLLVSGASVCHAVSFNNGQRFAAADHLAHVIVEADGEWQAKLLDAAESFWSEVRNARTALAN